MNDSVSARVGVFVRCRPLSTKEQMGKRCLSIANDTIHLGDKTFNFESVFGENTAQATIYDNCAKHLVEGCFLGYNGTVFACKV